jgi:hypothetical protein
MTVAVCIPTIPPRKRLLERALKSVSMQTLQPDEVIVEVDEEGLGAGPIRNRAWERAKSEWIAFLDDDDEFMPHHVQRCMRTAMTYDADLVYPWFVLRDWSEARPGRPDPLATMLRGELVHPLGVPFGHEQEQHLRVHPWIPATIVVKRELLEKVGGYPGPTEADCVARRGCEDWALLVRLLDIGARFVHHPERTWICYHRRGTAGRPWRDLERV